MGYIDVPCDIVNGTCDHNRKATIIGLTGQEIFRPQLKVLIKKMENFVYMGSLSVFKICVSFNFGIIVCLENSAT